MAIEIGKEKRKFERFDINVPVRIQISGQEGQGETMDLVSDSVSAGGIFLKLQNQPPEGSPVRIEILLNFEELRTPEDPEGALVIAATGQVLRSEPEGIAIRFNEDYDIVRAMRLH